MECKLSSVVLHVTDLCTSHCPYCYARATDRCFSHADVNTLYKIVDELSRGHVECVSLLGGDPALYPHILEVAKYLKEHDIRAGIMSNTMQFAAPLNEVTKYIDIYETTIHGKNALEHDIFSGKLGSYNVLMSNLRALSEYQKDLTIGIAINVIPQTSGMIYNIVESLIERERIHLDYIVLQRIIPYGRAENSHQYSLSKAQVAQALRDVEQVDKQLGITIAVEDPFPLCAIEERYHKYMHQCEWGYTKASLDGKGNLMRCGADSKHVLGNILETPLQEIWMTSPDLKAFREKSYLPETCKKCKFFSQCGGGCSLSCSSEQINAPDYLCTCF